MQKVVLVALGVLAACGIVLAFQGDPVSDPEALLAYGYGVRVLPDEEFADFMQCGISVYSIGSDDVRLELPSLRIMVGGGNSIGVRGPDGLDVRFTCAVNQDKTEVTYELEGQRDGQVVMSHLATVRFE